MTIATNMAGRGTDIQLGGNVEMKVLEALAANPEHVPSLEHLARLAFERGDRERADTLARRALRLDLDPGQRKRFSAWLAE